MNYPELYADFLKKHFDLKKPITVVCDCSNGSAGIVIEKLQNIKNLTIIPLNNKPDPEFPAHGPNPLIAHATDELSKKVLELKADCGVAFDADADRAVIVDNEGNTLPSFMTCILLFVHASGPFVVDELVYKSLQYEAIIPMENIIRSKVGTRYIKEHMKSASATVGGEFSGHYYFKDFFGADSGIFTMIQVANTLSNMSSSLFAFKSSLPVHTLINEEIKLGDKKWADIESHVRNYATKNKINLEEIEGVTLDTGTAWLNIRTSNTEPIVRLIGGGTTEAEVRKLVENIEAF